MTDHEVKITTNTTASTKFNTWGTGLDGKRLYVSNGATLKQRSPTKLKIVNQPSLTHDPRIIWSNDGSREVDRGSGLKVEDLTGNGNNGTKGSDCLENGPSGSFGANLKMYLDMQTLTDTGTIQDISGNSNHGTINGNVFDALGKFYRGRIFKGYTGATNVSISNAASIQFSTAITFGCWVKLDSLAGADGQHCLINKESSYGVQIG